MLNLQIFFIFKILWCEITKNFHIFATLLVENFLHVNICQKAINQKIVP